LADPDAAARVRLREALGGAALSIGDRERVRAIAAARAD